MRTGVVFLLPTALLAHMVSLSTGELHLDGAKAHYELRMPSYEAEHIRNPERTLFEHIHFRSGGVEARISNQGCRSEQGTFICVADFEFSAPPDIIDADCTFAQVTVPNHIHMLRAYRGDKLDQAVFDLSFTSAEIRFRPPAPWETAIREIAAGFLRSVTGAAPLLFVLSLVLASRGRRELCLLTVAFLSAEVLSAITASRIGLTLSPRFIEAAAALTIAYLAIEILLLPKSGQRWAVVGVLGLFHGAYFSLFLASSGYSPPTFLGGVVAGELLAIAVAYFAVRWLRALPRMTRAVPVAACALFGVGVVWFVLRLRG